MSANTPSLSGIELKHPSTSGRLFFLDLGAGRILSANTDGSGLKTIINEGRKFPDGLALDVAAGHKVWDRLKGVAQANNCVSNMLQIMSAARKAKIRIFYALHRRYRLGDYETWKYVAPVQKAAWMRKTFEFGRWGGEIRREFEPLLGEIVAQEHWGSSGFANTDLDLHLKKHGIERLIIIGLIAHTCVEATVRHAAEIGYEVTMVKDATADYSDEEMHAALDVNIPNYASAVVATPEVVEALNSILKIGN